MLAHRLRCWPKIVPTLVERTLFSMQMSDSWLNPKPLGVPPSLCVVQVLRQVFAY